MRVEEYKVLVDELHSEIVDLINDAGNDPDISGEDLVRLIFYASRIPIIV